MNTIRVDPQSWPRTREQIAGGAYEVIFAPGIYDGITVTPRQSGSVFRSEKIGEALLFSTASSISIQDNVNNVTFSGFACQARVRGVDSRGIMTHHITIEDCWIHHCAMDGIYGLHHSLTVRRCMVEGNGSHPGTHHGIYGGGILFRCEDTICRFNRGLGIAPRDGAQQMTIERCLCHSNQGGMQLLLPGNSVAKQASTILNSTFADNIKGDLLVDVKGSGSQPSWVASSCIAPNTTLRGFAEAEPHFLGGLMRFKPGFQGYYQSPSGWSGVAWLGTGVQGLPYANDPTTGAGLPRGLVREPGK